MPRLNPAIPLTPEGFQELCGVSDDDLGRLRAYVALLKKWQAKTNLVSNDSLGDVWRRHVLDSAQLAPLLGAEIKTIADIGTGAGFPGMVLAIIGAAEEVHLIESNERKCAFLREVNRATEAGAIIHNNRVENLQGILVDRVVSRAVASLEKLLQYANPLLKKGGQCLLLKGKKWREELTEAQKKWIINESTVQSLSDPSGMILKLKEIRSRDDS
jgi:16S rRNA (guanine527-N7)-methyltransferase